MGVIDPKMMRGLRRGAFAKNAGELLAISDKVLECARGELIFRQDAAADYCFLIIEGAAKLVRNRPGNKQIIVTIIAAGDAYFDPAMFEAGKYQAGCEAIARTRIVCVAKTALRDAMTCRPEFAFAVLAAISDRYSQFVSQIEQLKSTCVSQRIASFLLGQIEATTGSAQLYLPYDKWLIAQCIGAQPESFSRALKALRKIGVHITRDRVDIEDLGKLMAHACVECCH
jgi:CRP-like cAMP-binding protein